MQIRLVTLLIIVFATAFAPKTTAPEADTVIISVIGTNDVHGEFMAQQDRGGITAFSDYVAAIRELRADDGAEFRDLDILCWNLPDPLLEDYSFSTN